MLLKPGTRLYSQTCTTQLITVHASSADIDLRCGGQPLTTSSNPDPTPIIAGFDTGTALGKRYTDSDNTVELLCTKPGQGTLTLGATPLSPTDTKPLPASD